MDLLQMQSMCAMRSFFADEASRSAFATPEEGVLGQCSIAPPIKYTFLKENLQMLLYQRLVY
jgi:hypothetical protein